MVKRLISANTSEILAMSAAELKQSIKASEGRVILSENVGFKESYIGDITNSEMARAFGADLILLNGVDLLNPVISAIDPNVPNFVAELHRLVGRPIGVNLEPVDTSAQMNEERQELVTGRQLNEASLQAAQALGVDFICLTGNPGTGVTNKTIASAIRLTKQHFSGLVIAG